MPKFKIYAVAHEYFELEVEAESEQDADRIFEQKWAKGEVETTGRFELDKDICEVRAEQEKEQAHV